MRGVRPVDDRVEVPVGDVVRPRRVRQARRRSRPCRPCLRSAGDDGTVRGVVGVVRGGSSIEKDSGLAALLEVAHPCLFQPAVSSTFWPPRHSALPESVSLFTDGRQVGIEDRQGDPARVRAPAARGSPHPGS